MPSTDFYTDKELFMMISGGDEMAFEALFHRYVPKIQPVLMGLVQSEAAAQDIIQDIFLSLWVNRFKLPEVEVPSNWIYKIVYNRAYTWLEKQALHRSAQSKIDQKAAGNATEDHILFAETARLVQEAIYALPPKTKKIYQLSRDHGMKNSEIAEALNVSVNTVKNTLVNASKSIRDHLAAKGVFIPMVLVVTKIFF